MVGKRWSFLWLGLSIGLSPLLASADILAPGDVGAPDQFSLGTSFAPPPGQPVRTVVATTTGSGKVTAWNTTGFSGQVYEQVESDPGNAFCSGCLDFIFQVESTAGTIVGVSQNGLAGFQTDVGYETQSVGSAIECGPDDNGFCNSGSAGTIPSTVSRSADGTTVSFAFGGITAGDASVDLVIETNEAIFTDPILTMTSSTGLQGQVTVFGPAAPTMPESSTSIPLLVAMLALLTLGLRKRRLAYEAAARSRSGFCAGSAVRMKPIPNA